MAIQPPLLQAGDTIGIVTLGSPIDERTAKERIITLESMGFNVVLGEHTFSQNGFLAGSNEERAEDFMGMIRNEEVKMILPSRGGVGVAGILPYLDFEVIQNNPKIVTGYSDITVLINALYEFSNLITFHSLMLIDFRVSTPAYNFNQFYTAVSTTQAPRTIDNPPGLPLVSLVEGNVTGPLVGGNLTSFAGLLGTEYEVSTSGKIIFLEETNEPSNTVYRYLKQLEMAGKFDDCLGIVMGECTGCPVSYGVSYNEVVEDFLAPIGKPLITGLASGHGLFKAAVPIGAEINLNADDGVLTILESNVSLP
ncbi:LD-carboxypeptidase [Alteribacillus sp. HJP-4]|uniref:S66 peptidase family protein n=1 Tax=Alteribacillus sp. HJP-4 TaxID=2775394 RepID=UPI0035CCD320